MSRDLAAFAIFAAIAAALALSVSGCATVSPQKRFDEGYDGAYDALTKVENARKAGKDRVELDPFWGGALQAFSDKAEQFYIEQTTEALRQAVESMREQRRKEPAPEIKPDLERAPGEQP